MNTAIQEIHRRLIEHYGHHAWPARGGRYDPISELIFTVLSQHTSDVNAGRAMEKLLDTFGSWETVRDGDVQSIALAIQGGGLARVKAPRIKAILEQITQERGSLDLSFLVPWDLLQARAWLRSLPGVGPKTAACVLAFALNKPALPVDTHVHRVATRLGIIPPKTSAEKAHDLLEDMVPPEDRYDFHVNMIAHGRQVCKAPHPLFDRCFLRDICAYYLSREKR